MAFRVHHFEIGCRDRDESQTFYRSVFGWDSKPYGPLSHQFDTAATGGLPGFTTALGHEPHNYVMIYVEVDDIDQVLEQVRGQGGSIVVPATEVPGQGRFAWCKDPSGNLFGLWMPTRS